MYLPGYEHRTDTGETKVYVGDYAVIRRTGATRTVEYLLKDRLGSVDAVANSTGTLTETRGYDAFGKPRDGSWNDLTPAKIASTAVTPKGFTQHEHLNQLELIHMNGRAFDYHLGRFTGVDPFIQFPLNSQSLNPYSYILNNPLSGTDPTGYRSCVLGVGSNAGCSTSQMGTDTLRASQLRPKGDAWHMLDKAVGQAGIMLYGTNSLPRRGENGGSIGSGTTNAARSHGGTMISDILSRMLAEPDPLYAMGAVASVSAFQGRGYDLFPINNMAVTFDEEGNLSIIGHFKIDGDAADDGIESMRGTFSNAAGEFRDGRRWSVSFTFEVVQTAGDVHFNWMSPADQRKISRQEAKKGNAGFDIRILPGVTDMGANSMLFNPAYKSVDSIMRAYRDIRMSRSEAQSIYNYTRTTFPHEFSHGAGIDHLQNSTNALVSYSRSRHFTADDAVRWCRAALNENRCAP